MADEIYDKILYDDAKHTALASLAPDLFCLSFNGLSKAYRVAGFRSGWMAVSGPKHHAQSYIEGMNILANMRLCANVPAQHAIATALGGYQSINELILPGGRLHEQRNRRLGAAQQDPRGECHPARRARSTCSHGWTPSTTKSSTTSGSRSTCVRAEQILVVHGTGFNWPHPDHFRIVTLPHVDDLEEAIERIGNFLSSYRQ